MKLEIIEKRQIKEDKSSNNKLRVAAYVRVSSKHDDQLDSFESQVKYFHEKIIANPDWDFVRIYSDEGISGTNTQHRKGFNEMVEDAVNGKFDLLLTKSISRFARNTLDTLKYVRLLRDYDVAVLFEEENINTKNMAGELLLTILSSIAQQESLNLSEHVQLGLRMKMERGEIVGFCGCYGYNYDPKTKQLYVNKEQAKVVKMIFNWYVEGVPIRHIAKRLTEMKIPTCKGNMKWHHNAISKMLRNEKYAGDLLMGKYYTVPATVGKQIKNRGGKNKYYIKDHHEAIIDRDLYDKVLNKFEEYNKLYNTDEKLVNSFITRYTLSGRLKCAYCGNSLHRSNGYNHKVYNCRTVIDEGKEYCPKSRMQKEEVLKNIFAHSIKLLKKYCMRNNDKLIKYTSEKFIELSDEVNDKFSDKVFNSIIDYVIVGSTKSPFELYIVLKRTHRREDITSKPLEYFEKKKFKEILSFNYSTPFRYYEQDLNGKNKREVIVTKVPVTIQIEIGNQNES